MVGGAITLFLFWGRYLRRHEWIGTTFHVMLLVTSLVAAICLYRLAVATLVPAERNSFFWKEALTSRRGRFRAASTIAAGVLFGLVSLGAIRGVRSNKPIFGIGLPPSEVWWSEESSGPSTWVPRSMALIGYPPFANLTGSDLSQKEAKWSLNNADLDSVIADQLSGANLKYASAYGAFFANADLAAADLTGALLDSADLSQANLRAARLSGAQLEGAGLDQSNLTGAQLDSANQKHAHLIGATLTEANLPGTDLKHAHLIGATLNKANLTGTDLSYADLHEADLRGAVLRGAVLEDADLSKANLGPDIDEYIEWWVTTTDLTGAKLKGAKLNGAKLNGAILHNAELTDATLDGADLTYTDLRGVINNASMYPFARLDPSQVKRATNWEKAFYDGDMLKALGLASDHNQKLKEQQEKEQIVEPPTPI